MRRRPFKKGVDEPMAPRVFSTKTTWMAVIALGMITLDCGTARGGGITGVVSFGDSLSDVGNDYIASGGTEPPSPPYYQGHFSNGPIWLEYLAKDLGVSAPTPYLAGGSDYAFGGAETGPGYANFMGYQIPNIDTQIAAYFAAHNTPSPTQLFTIWGGANDALFGSSPNPQTSAANIAQEITTLANAGAKQFLIPNLPPLNLTPYALSGALTTGQVQGLAQFTVGFNYYLGLELPQLQQSLGVQIHEMDVNSLFYAVLANPGKYGFTNVTDELLLAPTNVTTGYLFWDEVHPTTQAGQTLGNLAFQSVPEPSSLIILATSISGLGAWIRFGLQSRGRGSRSSGRAGTPTTVCPPATS
ncbi:MAG: SGNH/GDSL hydrolase family protein [Isosphaerales bacterium]